MASDDDTTDRKSAVALAMRASASKKGAAKKKGGRKATGKKKAAAKKAAPKKKAGPRKRKAAAGPLPGDPDVPLDG
jgi:hypothetical protein